MWVIENFLLFINKDPVQITKSDLSAYVAHRKAKGVTAGTLNINFAALPCFYDFLVWEDLLSSNPFNAVRKRFTSSYKTDSEQHTHRLITNDELVRLIEACLDIRDKAMILTIFKTGIRRKELLSPDVEDVDLLNLTIHLKPTKKRSNLIVYFDEETVRYLKRWLRGRAMRNKNEFSALWIGTKGQLTSQGFDQIITKAAIKAGLQDGSGELEQHVTAHCGRHFHGTQLLRAGMPREYVKWLRGDKMREAIDIYNYIDPSDVKKKYLECMPTLGI
jgi:site-specific recombinase XerD